MDQVKWLVSTFIFASILSPVIESLAKSTSAPHSHIEIVSEYTTISPHHQNWIGLHIQVENGWHTYFKYPGDAGTPPQIDWSPSPAWTIGEAVWPTPIRISRPPIQSYGYEHEVLILYPITLNSNDRISYITLKAHVEWLVCQDICVPFVKSVQKSLPVQAERKLSSTYPLFQQTRNGLPKDLEHNVITRLSNTVLRVDLSHPSNLIVEDFIPQINTMITHDPPDIRQIASTRTQLLFTRSTPSARPSLEGLIIYRDTLNTAIGAPIRLTPASHTPWQFSAILLFICGLLGTLVAMCVCQFFQPKKDVAK